MKRAAVFQTLSRLYSLTGEDWHLCMDHILTEPTCPTAWVYPESDRDFSLFRCDADTIDQAIDGALRMAANWVLAPRQKPPEGVLSSDEDWNRLQGMVLQKAQSND